LEKGLEELGRNKKRGGCEEERGGHTYSRNGPGYGSGKLSGKGLKGPLYGGTIKCQLEKGPPFGKKGKKRKKGGWRKFGKKMKTTGTL